PRPGWPAERRVGAFVELLDIGPVQRREVHLAGFLGRRFTCPIAAGEAKGGRDSSAAVRAARGVLRGRARGKEAGHTRAARQVDLQTTAGRVEHEPDRLDGDRRCLWIW